AHRLVHGGLRFHEPRLVDADLIAALDALVPFAPNHLPDEIAIVKAFARHAPGVPQVVCFDTAFHADLPDVARRLAIPRKFHDAGIRRFGFHGLSYTSLIGELRRRASPSVAAGRIIIAHLGNGSSLAAVAGGRSIDTTMGCTPIGGIVMSTRAGD